MLFYKETPVEEFHIKLTMIRRHFQFGLMAPKIPMRLYTTMNPPAVTKTYTTYFDCFRSSVAAWYSFTKKSINSHREKPKIAPPIN